jgi:uncharacterized protein
MRIAWDDEKSRVNFAKHKVRFERAKLVFDDPRHLSIRDPCETEERWRTLGLVNGVVVLIVVHTAKEEENGEEEVRIISARKATPFERKAYDDRH